MKRVILIGFMGSGKSTLGKKIANRLNIPFIDSDQESKNTSKSPWVSSLPNMANPILEPWKASTLKH